MKRRSQYLLLNIVFLAALIAPTATIGATRPANSDEATTERYFQSVRKNPNLLLAFLREMPKGGDLHNHLTGSVYAESYIRSEEHTSELQSLRHLVCRLLLEK